MNFINLFRHPQSLRNLSPHDITTQLIEKPAPVILDVRTAKEYRLGHIKDAKSFPWGQEDFIANQYSVETPIVLICKTGHRSQAAADKLIKLGFQNLSHLQGGMDRWKREGYPITK